jgi:hypothetical protein
VTSAAWLSLFFLAIRPAVISASDCPSARDIEIRLSVLLPERTALPGTAVVHPTAEGLLVDLEPQDPAFAAQRSVVVGPPCDQRAEAAAVIIATWWPTESKETSQAPGVQREGRQEKRLRPFAVSAGGYASLVSGSMAPGARVEASFLPRGGGFGMRLAAAGTFSHEDSLAGGKVSWSRASLELGPIYDLRFVRLDAGLVGSLVWVGGSGFTEDQKESGLAAGLTLGVRAALPWARVQPWLELRGLAWPETQQMVVSDASTGLRSNRPLPHAEFQLGAGVAFSLF